MRNDKYDSSERNIEIKGPFVVVLIATVILLLAFTVCLFFVMNNEGDSPLGGGGGGGSKGDPSKTEQTTTGGASIPAGLNKDPLYPTRESRSSYKITTGSSVVTLTDGSFIDANSTVLVKVGADSLVSAVEKNADARIYPASMTKVMTLIIACELVTDMDKTLTVSKENADFAAANDASGAGLKVGEAYSVKDLLYLVSYKSDAIACLTLADYLVGGESGFVALMNDKAAKMGLSGTHFENCTGLYHENHYTTSKEMASIMAYAMDNELAWKILSSYNGYKMTVGGTDCTFYAAWYSGYQKNGHLGFEDNPKVGGTRIVAGKTGYTDESGFTFVTVSQDTSGQRYINVMVGKPKGQGYNATLFMADLRKVYTTYAK